jgi:magnesium-transporting ATPase (P-type)
MTTDCLPHQVLHEMPFTSESKRMGILLRHVPSGDLLFYVKGADAVMSERVVGADWLEEETGNIRVHPSASECAAECIRVHTSASECASGRLAPSGDG